MLSQVGGHSLRKSEAYAEGIALRDIARALPEYVSWCEKIGAQTHHENQPCAPIGSPNSIEHPHGWTWYPRSYK